jgi:hypothetical protein
MPSEKQAWLKAGDKLITVREKLGELKFTLTRRMHPLFN